MGLDRAADTYYFAQMLKMDWRSVCACPPAICLALGEYSWEVHKIFHGERRFVASTLKQPLPRLVAYHPDLLARIRPKALGDLQDLALSLAKVRSQSRHRMDL